MGSEPSHKSLHVCLVADAFRRLDGQGRVNLETARVVLERGHRLTILASVCADELSTHPAVCWIRIGNNGFPTQLLRNLRFASESAAWLRRHRADFDVIQANGFVTWEPCDIVAVHFVHSAWLESPSYDFSPVKLGDWYQLLFTRLNAHWEKKAFHTAKEVVAVSRKTAREVEALAVTTKPVRVIYNGVDTEEFRPGAACRESFGLPTDAPLALFVGDIQTPRKNLPTVLKAMQQVPELHLAVAAVKEGSPYIAMAEELGIGHRVHFLGKTSQVSNLMRSADLMVFPSRYEAHPLVVMEALACGLPTIVSARIAQGEAFEDACVVVPDPDDANRIASEVRRLLADDAAREKLSKAGRALTGHLTWHFTGSQYTALYEEFAGRSSSMAT